ncbi:non-structural maintenance of chromosomes element 1 homolog isoform X1 [Neophocaena asiaeorientalis asiaeorientalis]|uniref:Non-structural maintenance of chromosomes element 1 homolog n=1 Tax=Neophocaena asiaeorientalis asiaeorientalis TaxID=1706337 RepID=A0A341BCV2_NEOAA|nr:non-structural maintenance of chromosomes element 1 homolog isoform X1 [Neophocaena asiaeorientalis asiaeorientalis]
MSHGRKGTRPPARGALGHLLPAAAAAALPAVLLSPASLLSIYPSPLRCSPGSVRTPSSDRLVALERVLLPCASPGAARGGWHTGQGLWPCCQGSPLLAVPGGVTLGTATVEKLEDFINNINSVLESLYIEIKKGVTEDDGRPIYALVNLATTSISKMASDFAENELDLFRKALELIIDSETGFASSTNILNLVDQLKGKKMRKKEAEHVLQKFVQNKWLIEKEGEFTLHGRAILEMEQYIRETYPDAVKVCTICHSLLIQGQSCETCGIRMHLPCVAKYFQSHSELRCPHCKDYWPHEIPEVFDPEKEREASISKSNKRSLRSRQH